jgi:hypothetical protein
VVSESGLLMTVHEITVAIRQLERRAARGEELARLALDYALPNRGMIPVKIMQMVQAKARRLMRAAK